MTRLRSYIGFRSPEFVVAAEGARNIPSGQNYGARLIPVSASAPEASVTGQSASHPWLTLLCETPEFCKEYRALIPLPFSFA